MRRRYEREAPGELLDVETKRLGRFWESEPRERRSVPSPAARTATGGPVGQHVHVAIDDKTQRLAPRAGVRLVSLAAPPRWARALRQRQGSLFTGVDATFAGAWRASAYTRAYRQTNGKAERVIQALFRGWAYIHSYPSGAARVPHPPLLPAPAQQRRTPRLARSPVADRPRLRKSVVSTARLASVTLTKHAEWPDELRAIASIKGWLSPAAATLLYDLASRVTNGCIVEVGSYRGRSTVALARGSAYGREAPVFAVEPHEPFVGVRGGEFGADDRGAFFRNMLRTGAYRNVRLLNISSEVLVPGWRFPVALLWLDGDHSYDGVRRDFDAWQPHLLRGCDVVFDDTDDPDLGPYRVVQELLEEGWAEVGRVDRVVHLRRR